MVIPILLISVPVLGTFVIVLVATKMERSYIATLLGALIGTFVIPVGAEGWRMRGLLGRDPLWFSLGTALFTAFILWHVRNRYPHWFE